MVLHIRIWLAFLLTESIGEGTKTCIVLQLRFCATCLFETLKAFPVLKQRTWRSSDRNQDACSKRAYLPCYARASFFVSGQGFPRYSLYVFLVTAHTFSVRFSRLRPFPFPVTNEAELQTWQTRQGLRMFCENWLAGSNLLARVSVKLAASGDPCVYMYCTEHEDCKQARCHF